MRSIVYIGAAVAAAGIAMLLSAPQSADHQSADHQSADQPIAGGQSAATAAALTSGPAADSGTLTLRVEDMHCEHGCFPTVRKTLQQLPQVVSVTLDQQAEEGTLDNPQVVIQYDPGFDLSNAQAQLAQKGFARTNPVP